MCFDFNTVLSITESTTPPARNGRHPAKPGQSIFFLKTTVIWVEIAVQHILMPFIKPAIRSKNGFPFPSSALLGW
jgi:hypothetical protein